MFVEGGIEAYRNIQPPLTWRYSVPMDEWLIYKGALCRLRHNIDVNEGHVNGALYWVSWKLAL